MEEWGAKRVGDLVGLCAPALPAEGLTAQELDVCWWDGGGTVLATPAGDGAVAVVARGGVGHVRLVAVAPAAQRRGVGGTLLDAAHGWLHAAGCTEVVAGGEAPFYLWPGVDTAASAACGLFEAAGYRAGDFDWVNMAYPATFQAEPPVGIEVRRVDRANGGDSVAAFVDRHFPEWTPEVDRALAVASCFAATARESPTAAVVGFVCHSVVRTGWLGPMGTDPARRHGGVGAALLGAVAADLAASGRTHVEVEWVGPKEFYAHAAGAVVSRVFRRFSRRV